MKILKKVITRLNITILLLAVQIFLFVRLFATIINYLPVIAALCYLLSIVIVLLLIKKDEASAYKVTWIVVIMSLPVLGGILYLLFGNKRPTKLIAAHIKEHALIAKILQSDSGLHDNQQIMCDRMSGILRYIRHASSYPAYGNTAAKYYPFGELMFEDMLIELKSAKKFIFLEYFIVAESKMWGEIVDILLQKAENGVDVRIIFDDMGSRNLFTIPYAAKLRAKKIRLVRFNPIVPFLSLFMNNRDHRKIMVIDGHTAFCGGINIADKYINQDNRLGVWKDTGLRLKGAAVWSFTLMFIETWNAFCRLDERIKDYAAYENAATKSPENDGAVIPYGDSPLEGERLGESIYIDILNQATRYVYIFTPYLIISEKMIYALQMAAKRGVDVRIVTPGIPDKKIVYRLTRSFYRYLIEAGIRIYEYAPGFLHAKSFVCDDNIAVVGTINLDYRSLYLHFECATLLYESSAVKDIAEDAIKTMAEGREILEYKGSRLFEGRLFDAILHLLAPLM